MRKPAFCICENKDADQLRGNREADQRLCFRYMDSTIPLLPKSKKNMSQAIFCGCTAWFVSDLVGNPEDRFSHNEAQIIPTAIRLNVIMVHVLLTLCMQGNFAWFLGVAVFLMFFYKLEFF